MFMMRYVSAGGFMVNFFQSMKGFSSYSLLSDGSLYVSVPDDWWVVVTDVKGSTKAIEEGRYKDVNTIGVASIVAMSNVMKEEQFPFVFGGDGATAIIPPEKKDAIQQELSSLRSIASSNFQLSLRVGMVDMGTIRQRGGVVEVAKYELQSQVPLAFFRGGGLQLADTLIKEEQETYEIPDLPAKEIDLRTLSCRWKPIPSTKGQMISLLILAKKDPADEVYAHILKEMASILDDFQDSHPVQPQNMTYRSRAEMLRDDIRFQNSFWRRWYRKLETFVASILFHEKISSLFSKLSHYNQALPAHSDYQKFDDALRMILDCSEEQISALRELFEQFHQRGDIFYGIHTSETALMTCVFEGFNDGHHVHFIDGGKGGYAMAAKQLKAQLRVAKN